MNHAKFAQAAYALNLTNKNLKKRLEAADDILKDTGYKTHESSNREVSLYMNPEHKTAVIAHRGTAFNNRRDIAGDLAFVSGNADHSKEFDRRKARSEKMLKHIPKDHTIHYNGYSYGGATVIHALAKSPKLRNRLNGEVHLYNPLTSTHIPDIVPGLKENKEDVIKLLNEKVTTHRTPQDIVSMPGTFGKVETHQPNYKYKGIIPKHLEKVFETANQLSTHSIKNFI
jgi:hypothetical protein